MYAILFILDVMSRQAGESFRNQPSVIRRQVRALTRTQFVLMTCISPDDSVQDFAASTVANALLTDCAETCAAQENRRNQQWVGFLSGARGFDVTRNFTISRKN